MPGTHSVGSRVGKGTLTPWAVRQMGMETDHLNIASVFGAIGAVVGTYSPRVHKDRMPLSPPCHSETFQSALANPVSRLFSCRIPQDTVGLENNRTVSNTDRDGKVLDNRGCGYNYLLIHDKRPRGIHRCRQPPAVARGVCAGPLARQSLRPAQALGRTISTIHPPVLNRNSAAGSVFCVLLFQPVCVDRWPVLLLILVL